MFQTEILSCASNGAYSLESQMDNVAAESESTPTVNVTWEEKKNEDGEHDDIKEETVGGEHVISKKTAGEDVSKR